MSVEVESDTKSADKRPSRGKKVNYSNLNKGIPQEEDKDEDSSSQLETAESGAGSSESDAPLVDPFYEQPGTSIQTGTHEFSFPDFQVDTALAREDEENNKLRLELEALKKQELLLAKRVEADELRKQLAEQKAKVARLRGNFLKTESRAEKRVPSHSKVKTSMKHSKHENSAELFPTIDDDVDINKLRKNKSLKKSVKKQLKELALDNSPSENSDNSPFPVDSQSEAESALISNTSLDKKEKRKALKLVEKPESDSNLSFSTSDSDVSSSNEKRKKKKKSKKSGIKAKASDSVRHPQKYPQAFLRYEFVSSNLSFDKLDLNLFVAGELEIISDRKIKDLERSGRINLLKKIMYLSTSYDFSTLKSFYAACLREIEVGNRTWSDDFSSVETAILQKFVPKARSFSHFGKKTNYKNKRPVEGQTEKEGKLWFCPFYQRNKCEHKGNHLKVINGRNHYCQHVCATCWQKDSKKLEHPECSSACPYAKA